MTTKTTLAQWGWNEFYQKQIGLISSEKLARVIKEERDHYVLINGVGQVVGGIISGNWKKRREDFINPSVGDWVILSDKANEKAGLKFFLIDKRLERFSQILRKTEGSNEKSQLLAANVDFAFLVSSCNQDFDVRRIERYLALLNDGIIRPILILNKCDLPSFEDCREKIILRFPSIPIILTRSDQPESINALHSFLKLGITCVFLGSSGVGKSTLTNLLLNEDIQLTQQIRNKDSKGRHTTSGRSMFMLANKLGLIIDTPGLREVQLPIQDSNLENAFSNIAELGLKCRFQDCRHQAEPNCAVKLAVKNGELFQDQLDHFHKLKAEIDKKNLKRTK